MAQNSKGEMVIKLTTQKVSVSVLIYNHHHPITCYLLKNLNLGAEVEEFRSKTMVMIRFNDKRRLAITEKEVKEMFEKYTRKNEVETEDCDEPP